MDVSCVIYNIIAARRLSDGNANGQINNNLASVLSGMTVRFLGTDDQGNPINEVCNICMIFDEHYFNDVDTILFDRNSNYCN